MREVKDQTRVDGARARGPRQAGERCQAHGRVPRLTFPNAARRRAGAEMQGNEVGGAGRFVEVRGNGTQDVGVG